MANDQSQHVKGSMAQAICDLAEYLSEEEIMEYILPPIINIMKDSVTEVRVSLMQNIGKLAKHISEEQIDKVIIPQV